ncbi:MAG: XRE family transcriptional regulator [Chloroflexi bacterium]|nr:XRE family transcriptional regulator [Chloroflexota bacterium]
MILPEGWIFCLSVSRTPDGSEYSYEEVQNGTGKAVTAAYIWRLRTGKATNPGYWVIKALSDFFGVDPNYFFQDEEQAREMAAKQANTNLADRFQDSSVKDIALRASELDEAGRRAILGMIDYILQNKPE